MVDCDAAFGVLSISPVTGGDFEFCVGVFPGALLGMYDPYTPYDTTGCGRGYRSFCDVGADGFHVALDDGIVDANCTTNALFGPVGGHESEVSHA